MLRQFPLIGDLIQANRHAAAAACGLVSAHLFRCGFRLVVLSVFANFGTQSFGITFSMLLAMAAIFCAIAGATRREQIFGPALSHWDEAVTYAALSHLVGELV